MFLPKRLINYMSTTNSLQKNEYTEAHRVSSSPTPLLSSPFFSSPILPSSSSPLTLYWPLVAIASWRDRCQAPTGHATDAQLVLGVYQSRYGGMARRYGSTSSAHHVIECRHALVAQQILKSLAHRMIGPTHLLGQRVRVIYVKKTRGFFFK